MKQLLRMTALFALGLSAGWLQGQTAASTASATTSTNAAGVTTVTTTTITTITPAAPVIVPAPVIASFTASPNPVSAGQSVTLSWNVSNAVTLELSDGSTTVAAPASPYVVSPATTVTYTLTAANATASVSAAVTVTVNPVVITPPPPPPSSCTGTAVTAAQVLSSANTTYCLQADVSGSFQIAATNVTLNLNGYTITYSTMPGVYGCNNGGTMLLSGVTCASSGKFSAPTVTNGTITQAAGSPYGIAALYFGTENASAGYPTGGSITDLTINVSGAAAQAVRLVNTAGGWNITGNTIHDTVTNIQSSSQSPYQARELLSGYAIFSSTEDGSALPNAITGNTIQGAPQGGITDGHVGSTISNNTIALTATYSNDYGVASLVSGQTITHNTVTGAGRGLDVEASGFILSDNTVNVAENGKNTEYNGCELDGTYGIRLKNYGWPGSTEPKATTPVNWNISGNSVTVTTPTCPGVGLDFTDMTSGVSGSVASNIVQVSGTQTSYALGFQSNSGAAIAFTGNNLNAGSCVLIGGDGDLPYGSWSIAAGQLWSCAKGPTVAAQDDTYPNGAAPQLTIEDTIANPSVSCLAYSTAQVAIGTFAQTCNLKGQ